ncbi:hypothetical protein BD413DRAFT_476745 [Trametes elegans]|nr:hypothetical protein BD413DRAFT_476745 [Trametes elegans]
MDEVIAGLSGAKKLAEAIPVPGVKAAISMALSAAELVREVQDTRDGCKTLAERAAQHTLGIYDELARCGIAVDGGHATHCVKQLLGALEGIKLLMQRRQKMGKFILTLKKHKISKEVEKLAEQLDDALQLFQVRPVPEFHLCLMIARPCSRIPVFFDAQSQTLIRINHELAGSSETRAADTERSENIFAEVRAIGGTLTTLAGRLESVVEVDKVCDDVMDVDPEPRAVQRYRGRLRTDGTALIVKRFEKQDTVFQEEVDLLKRLWHPNILEFRGYSPDPDVAFIAFNMACHAGSFESLSRVVHGVDKLLWVIDAVSTAAALQHLKTKSPNIDWCPDNEAAIEPITGGNHLIVTAESRILLDVSRCPLDKLPNLVILWEWVSQARHKQLLRATDICLAMRRLSR